jgi:methylated-DNA-[protein]-cysteine S-methyltransferase
MDTVYINSPLGITKIVGDENGVCLISILKENLVNVETSKVIPKSLQNAVTELKEYFENSRTIFTFKINFKGTDFQQKVWRELLHIPYGKTISYLELSKKIGDVKAIRAVASANGKNPLWIVVPCHRVIGSDGSLTGYAGGLWRKKWLLDHENPVKQQSLF